MNRHRIRRACHERHQLGSTTFAAAAARGAAFGFDAEGCVFNWSLVISAYISGDLTEAEMVAVEEHQAGCVKCHNGLMAHLGVLDERLLPGSLFNGTTEGGDVQQDTEAGDEDSEDDFDQDDTDLEAETSNDKSSRKKGACGRSRCECCF